MVWKKEGRKNQKIDKEEINWLIKAIDYRLKIVSINRYQYSRDTVFKKKEDLKQFKNLIKSLCCDNDIKAIEIISNLPTEEN